MWVSNSTGCNRDKDKATNGSYGVGIRRAAVDVGLEFPLVLEVTLSQP